MRLDIHPRSTPKLKDPQIDAWITEAIPKADALASLGLCSIGILGVWNWRGRNEYGGITALADWDSIALKGRKVILCFNTFAK
jgi:hypothetical protein